MKKALLITIRVIAILVLVASLTMLGIYLVGDLRDTRTANEIDRIKNNGKTNKDNPDILEDYESLYAENKDVIGWLKIDGTSIDYVVMQAPDEVEKYIHTDFYGRPSYRGCLYVDEDCDVLRSDNIIIYGHHMKDGSMFGDLIDYTDESFYRSHKIIHFDTIYEKHTYEIVGAIKTSIPAEDEDCFRYYLYTGEDDEESFSQYKRFIFKNKLYPTEAELTEGDKILTLSTCAYHTESGRFIVVARQVS